MQHNRVHYWKIYREKLFSLPNLAPRLATSSKHKITCFSFFRIIRSSVSKSRHSKICRQFLYVREKKKKKYEKLKVNKFKVFLRLFLLQNAPTINQNKCAKCIFTLQWSHKRDSGNCQFISILSHAWQRAHAECEILLKTTNFPSRRDY